MESRSIKKMMIASVIVIVVCAPFIVIRLVSERPRPVNDLAPYPEDTTDLNLVIQEGPIEIRIIRHHIGIGESHTEPPKMGCSVTINVTNTGQEDINNFEAVMGTTFEENNEVIYSYWVGLRIKQIRWMDVSRVAIPSGTTIEVFCYDIGDFVMPGVTFSNAPNFAYLRIQYRFSNNITAILTTPLTYVLYSTE